jgi:hypothetical protein
VITSKASSDHIDRLSNLCPEPMPRVWDWRSDGGGSTEQIRREFRSDLNPKLADFLVKACSGYRADQFTTALQMRQELESIRLSI